MSVTYTVNSTQSLQMFELRLMFDMDMTYLILITFSMIWRWCLEFLTEKVMISSVFFLLIEEYGVTQHSFKLPFEQKKKKNENFIFL